jgi:hypothetical protein
MSNVPVTRRPARPEILVGRATSASGTERTER